MQVCLATLAKPFDCKMNKFFKTDINFKTHLKILLGAYNQTKYNFRELKQMSNVQARNNTLIHLYYFLYLEFKDYAFFVWHREHKEILKESLLKHN